MENFTEFLIKCRYTQTLSNQNLLSIIDIYLKNENYENIVFDFLLLKLGTEKFEKFTEKFDSIAEIQEKAITFIDSKYPEQLRQIYNPPALLFYRGDISLLETKCLGVVGSRKATKYGEKCCNNFMPNLVGEYTIVSGLAKGIDAMAHVAALNNNGKTIAVLGNSLDIYYPKINESVQKEIFEKGLVITEYPSGSKINRWHFPQRNRIISGLSEKVIVVEAEERSGALITADLALENNRDVLAVPGRVDSKLSAGCNKLIEQGAIPLINLNNF
ncbi:DNA-processing protein DprA [Lactobacillus terrae]|uniref:DNA-processing protein DprA n=1 Tax=Lactobacillus terrae TaxID=2269374 RepID=UPI000C1B6D0C|nr:DNA-processing protein DprA [Lactobacillus terrae]